jgi:hypothetical protein
MSITFSASSIASLGRVCAGDGDVGTACRLGDALAFAINPPPVSRDVNSIAQKNNWESGTASVAVYLFDGNRPRFMGTVGVPDKFPLPRVEQIVDLRKKRGRRRARSRALPAPLCSN